MNKLHDQIASILNKSICDNKNTYNRFSQRLMEGLLTRDENAETHFSTYFLPYNPKNKKIFIVHHKKSGLWIFPGGHIDKDEILIDTLNREIDEELGVKSFFKKAPPPFLLTVTPIENEKQTCKEHLDIWHLMETDGSDFNVDPREFHETKWMDINEALEIVTDPPNRSAIEKVKNLD